jgi:hypothetical protein
MYRTKTCGVQDNIIYIAMKVKVKKLLINLNTFAMVKLMIL